MKGKLLKVLTAAMVTVSIVSAGATITKAAVNYTVKPNDCLKKIAQEVYGDESQWQTIYEVNKWAIKDPNLIYKGQVFVIPDLAGATAVAAAAEVPALPSVPAVPTVPETPAVAVPQTAEIPAVPAPTVAPVPATPALPATTVLSAADQEAKDFCLLLMMNLVSEMPDSKLAFFDTNKDFNISADEFNALWLWAIDRYNTGNKAEVTDAEMIAIGKAVQGGGIKLPSTLYYVK